MRDKYLEEMLDNTEHAFWEKENKVEISRRLYELLINKVNYLEKENEILKNKNNF